MGSVALPDRASVLTERDLSTECFPGHFTIDLPSNADVVTRALAVARPLNSLNAEALGAALLLDIEIAGDLDAPLLRSGASDLSKSYRLVD